MQRKSGRQALAALKKVATHSLYGRDRQPHACRVEMWHLAGTFVCCLAGTCLYATSSKGPMSGKKAACRVCTTSCCDSAVQGTYWAPAQLLQPFLTNQ